MSKQMNLESVIQELKNLIKKASKEPSAAHDSAYVLTIKVNHGGSIGSVCVKDGRPAEQSELLKGIELPQRDPRPVYLEKAEKDRDEARAAFDKVDAIYQETTTERERERADLRSRGASLNYETVKLRDHDSEIAAASQERKAYWKRVVTANTALGEACRRWQIEREQTEFEEAKRRAEAKKAGDLKRRRLTLGPALERLKNRVRGTAAA